MTKREAKPPVHGVVLDSDSLAPLGGRVVRLMAVDRYHDEDALGEARTRKDGSFRIRYGRRTAWARQVLAALPEGGPPLVLQVYEGDEVVHRSSAREGAARFESWVTEVAPVPSAAVVINERVGAAIEQCIKDPKLLRLICNELARESGRPADEIYDAIVDSDPFGIDPFTFRTTICCVLNNLMDAFKQTPLATQLLFGGNHYRHLFDRTVRGWLIGVENRREGRIRGPSPIFNVAAGVRRREEIDQDFNFELQPTMPSLTRLWLDARSTRRVSERELQDQFTADSIYTNVLNCEIVPCDQVGTLRGAMGELQALRREDRDRRGQGLLPLQVQLEIDGTITWDGTHDGFPGHLEVHPTRAVRILSVIRP